MSTDTAPAPTAISPPAETEQTTMFDLGGAHILADFYNDQTPIFIPNNPLHFKAHKLEVLVKNLERQAVKNAAQFNSKNYLDAVDALMKCYEQIKEAHDEILESERVAASRNNGGTPKVGDGDAVSVDPRVSANNPLAG